MFIEVNDYLKFMVQVDTYVGEKLLNLSKMFFDKRLIKEELILDGIIVIPSYNEFNKSNICTYMIDNLSYTVVWFGENKKSVLFITTKDHSPMTIKDGMNIFKYIKPSVLNLDYGHTVLLHGDN